ncbi:MAG: BatA domain-containing protein [Acidobacteriota bacterium]|nr:BatA domain-containing protein [Acidobacteriota bacterium]
MSFLTPLFLLGLAGLAVPVIIHLIQRERKNVVHFPSLMFLQRIPYQSVRRRRVRNWPLLLLRLAALALIVAAFARPFLRRQALAAAAAGGAREVVVLLDRSYSMGYGDRWARATAAARSAIGSVGQGDRASIVLFASGADVALRSASDRGRLEAAVLSSKPGAGATRYGPALKLAGSIASESTLPRREVILISDFQRSGWQGAEGVRLPDGVVLTAVPVGDADTANVTVTPVSMQRSMFSGQDRVTITGGAVNHGPATVSNLGIVLELEGRPVQTERIAIEPNSSTSVSFTPFSPAVQGTRGTVRIAPDALNTDNAFHFVVTPRAPVKVVIAERSGSVRDSSLYLSRALSLGDEPAFDVSVKSIEGLTLDDLQRAAVVIVNDAPVSQLAAERLGGFVARGGGLLVAAGERAAWPARSASAAVADVLPGQPGAFVDRTLGTSARLGALEYGNPIFEPFRAARSGDFSSARFYSYRSVVVGEGSNILARFDDGAPALLERRVGEGRVLLWTSSLDLQWNDLPLKSVFLPFVHRMATTLASYRDKPAWLSVGDVLEPARPAAAPGGPRAASQRAVLTPSGERVPLDGEGPDVLELSEQGFYEIRAQGRDGASPVAVASNLDLSESDLSPMDPQEVVAGATGRAGGAAGPGANVAPTDLEQERTQRLWWYLLFAGVVLLAAETFIGNRLSRTGTAPV